MAGNFCAANAATIARPTLAATRGRVTHRTLEPLPLSQPVSAPAFTPESIADLAPGKEIQFEVVPFDEILNVVEAGKYDAGLIIHEGQLTFQNQGLQLVVDLGAWWFEKTGLPLPLGGNVIRKDLGPKAMADVSRLLRESIVYGLEHRREALDYALQYARDMDVTLADKFVGMYVNDWTLDYGDRGRTAVKRLLDEAHKAGIIPSPVAVEFVE